jgi:hypothetical protein
MTNFLPAGIISDQLKDIYDFTCQLEKLLNGEEISPEAQESLQQIKTNVKEVLELIEGFPCQPLIYTGQGTTEEVIARLEWILALVEPDKSQLNASAPTRKKRRKKMAFSGK